METVKKKNKNNETFTEYLGYRYPLFLVNQSKNKQILNWVNYTLMDLRNAFNKKAIPEMKILIK